MKILDNPYSVNNQLDPMNIIVSSKIPTIILPLFLVVRHELSTL